MNEPLSFKHQSAMNVLSLFDGMGCGAQALKQSGIGFNGYFASEIDKYAIKIAKKNHPEIQRLGDVVSWRDWHLPKIDLLIGGSPCQGFSIAGKRLNFDDPRSRLFFEFVNCLKYFKPKYFLLENVRMKKEIQDVISAELGCEPVFIDSALVSAQTRKRLYWCNWTVDQPAGRGIFLKDVLEDGDGIIHTNFSGNKTRHYKKSCALRAGASANYQVVFKDKNKPIQVGLASNIKGHDFLKRIYSVEGKCPTLTAVCGGNQERKIAIDESHYRKLTPMECERLQTLPDGYTDSVSNSQRYKMIGNGWTVSVVEHIFRSIPVKSMAGPS